ncbi:dynein axonemal heavy chain 17-like [Mercenaria mercenaria]|uniref:dynein axonemal heavy chain 17-like n=1 Tax=Mercenaria mercenaria TaxID=6596 RepID=UPI00234F83D8|nr:dynein axonemal heavy chain 17-like [Mercenaria mercenaria]
MEASGTPVDYDRMSIISRASTAVSQLPKKDFQEMKSFANPPVAVIDVLSASMLLLGHKDSETNWKMIKSCLGKTGKESVQERVAALDVEKIPEKNLKKAKDILAKYDLNGIANVSQALKELYIWAGAVTDD